MSNELIFHAMMLIGVVSVVCLVLGLVDAILAAREGRK